jgi:hypothetical protein
MDNLTLFIFPAVALVLQSAIFFVTKNIFVRLIPSLVTFVFTAAFFITAFTTEGWDRLGALLLALLASVTLAAFAFAWMVWAIIRLIKRAKLKKAK